MLSCVGYLSSKITGNLVHPRTVWRVYSNENRGENVTFALCSKFVNIVTTVCPMLIPFLQEVVCIILGFNVYRLALSRHQIHSKTERRKL